MSVDAPLPIFVSCGSPYTAAQEDFISAVEAHLKSHGCTPQTVGRSNYSVRQPVQASRDRIGECRGAVVIAFERTRILKAIERPDSAEQKDIFNESHPTIWNQMEAAMAYSQNVPILTFVQRGLKRQGMLSDRFEWTALEADLLPALLRTERFQQVFEEWLGLVRNGEVRSKVKESDISEMKIGALLTQLNAKQAWTALVIAFGILSGLATTDDVQTGTVLQMRSSKPHLQMRPNPRLRVRLHRSRMHRFIICE